MYLFILKYSRVQNLKFFKFEMTGSALFCCQVLSSAMLEPFDKQYDLNFSFRASMFFLCFSLLCGYLRTSYECGLTCQYCCLCNILPACVTTDTINKTQV